MPSSKVASLQTRVCRLVLILLAASVAGCVIADPSPAGKACDESHACPSPLVCIDQVCQALDGGSGAPDARPVAPDAAAGHDASTPPSPDASTLLDAGPTGCAAVAGIVIDGSPDEPAWAGSWEPVAKVVLGASFGVTGEFKTRWSASYLYLAFRVSDPALHGNATDPWDGDAVEVFLDMAHDRSATYQPDDFHFILGWNAPIWEAQGRTTGVSAATAKTAEGYSAEIAIPWSTLATVPAAGAVYGIEAGIDIDQTGGGRAGQLVWTGTDQDFQDTSAFGDATLQSGCLLELKAYTPLPSDAGTPDAGTPDVGTPDVGAAPPDAGASVDGSTPGSIFKGVTFGASGLAADYNPREVLPSEVAAATKAIGSNLIIMEFDPFEGGSLNYTFDVHGATYSVHQWMSELRTACTQQGILIQLKIAGNLGDKDDGTLQKVVTNTYGPGLSYPDATSIMINRGDNYSQWLLGVAGYLQPDIIDVVNEPIGDIVGSGEASPAYLATYRAYLINSINTIHAANPQCTKYYVMGLPFWSPLTIANDMIAVPGVTVGIAFHWYYDFSENQYGEMNAPNYYRGQSEYWQATNSTELTQAKAVFYDEIMNAAGLQTMLDNGISVHFEEMGCGCTNPNALQFMQDAYELCQQHGLSYGVQLNSTGIAGSWYYPVVGFFDDSGAILSPWGTQFQTYSSQ